MNHGEKILEAAFTYLDMGYSVIPVSKQSKVPLIPWKEYQQRRASVDELVSWFEHYGNDWNVGIVCGAISGLTVVDIENGGSVVGLPMTKIARTQGGGWHYYYKHEAGVMNGVRVRELMDIRSESGYVLAPPSVGEKGEYSWVVDEKIVDFPKDLLPIVKRQTSSFKNIGGISYIEDVNRLPKYEGSAEGSRNDSMARYIGKVLKMVHPSDWDTVAAKAMVEANKMNNPPLEMRELESIYESIKGREKLNPPVVLRGNVMADDEIDNDDVDYMYKAADIARPKVREFYPTGFSRIDESIGGGWKNGDLVVITGRSGHGKTTVAQTFSYNLVTNNMPVLFFSYEVLVDIVWDQFQSMGLTSENLIFAPLKTTTGRLDWIEKKIKEAIDKFKIKAVVLDHLGFLAPTETHYSDAYSANYAAYLTQMCRDLKNIARNQEIVIFLLAHVKKTDMKKDISQEDISQSNGPLQESDFLFSIQRTPYDSEQTKGQSVKEFVETDLSGKGEGEELYGHMSKLSLLKNRMTGKSFWMNIRKKQQGIESVSQATGPFIQHIKDEDKNSNIL